MEAIPWTSEYLEVRVGWEMSGVTLCPPGPQLRGLAGEPARSLGDLCAGPPGKISQLSDLPWARRGPGIPPNPINFIGFGAMAVTKPYEFIRFGAMDLTKPYKFIGFGAMAVTKPYEFIGFGAMDAAKPYEFIGFGASK